jgi:hypothetical protein
MDIGIFLPTGTRGYLISSTAPLNNPTYDLNRHVVVAAERYGVEFALSMVKFRGFGGESRYWDGALEPFTLTAALAAVTKKIRLFSTTPSLVMPPAVVARMIATLDDIAWPRRPQCHHRLAEGGVRADGCLARRCPFRTPLRRAGRVCPGDARAVANRMLELPGPVLPDGRLPVGAATFGTDRTGGRRRQRARPGVRGATLRLQFLCCARHNQQSRGVPRAGRQAESRGGTARQGRESAGLGDGHRRGHRRGGRGEVGALPAGHRSGRDRLVEGAGLGGSTGEGSAFDTGAHRRQPIPHRFDEADRLLPHHSVPSRPHGGDSGHGRRHAVVRRLPYRNRSVR